LTPKQIQRELTNLERQAKATDATVAALEHDRDTLKEELTATKKALAKAETKATAAEKSQQRLAADLWELRKQFDKLRDTRDDEAVAYKRHVNSFDTASSKLNKLWLKVEEMERRERERDRASQAAAAKAQRLAR